MNTPIILLHGWGFTPDIWTPVVNALAQRGLDRARIAVPALPLQTGELSHSIHALSALIPERAHIVGWSLGGELALAFANQQPARIASLTLIASTPCFMNRHDWLLGQPESLLDDFDQRLADNPAALLKRFSMLIRHGDANASRDRVFSDTLAQAYESDSIKLANGLRLLRSIDLRPSMNAGAAATLLIHGTQDAVVPMAAADWLARHTGATLHSIDGASHALPLTHAPQIADQLHPLIEQRA